MGIDIDLYEFKETLARFNDNEKWIEIVTDKSVGMVEVGKATKEEKEKD